MNENQRRELLNEKKSGWLETSENKSLNIVMDTLNI